jgi:bacterioferritin
MDKVIKELNVLLKMEFVGIRQYWLNGLTLKFDGIEKLAKEFLEEASETGEAVHVELIANRILTLGGKLECDAIDEKCNAIRDIEGMLNSSLELEKNAIKKLKEVIHLANNGDDFTTADMLTTILKDEEDHKKWIEQQLSLIEKMGIQNYIACNSGCC